MSTTMVVIRTQIEGFHHWPSAPAHRAYLGVRHRHLFHIEVAIEVTDHDRQIEFHDLRDQVLDMLPKDGEFGSMSCEAIALMCANWMHDAIGVRRKIRVGVFEDGECGAEVTR